MTFDWGEDASHVDAFLFCVWLASSMLLLEQKELKMALLRKRFGGSPGLSGAQLRGRFSDVLPRPLIGDATGQ